MNTRAIFLAALAVAGAAGAAWADLSVTFPGSIPTTTTDWNFNTTLPQWDPAAHPGQYLTSVTLNLSGTVSGRARAQNGDQTPATVTYNLAAQIVLNGPAGGAVQILPLASGSTMLGAAVNPILTFMAPDGVDTSTLTNSASNNTSILPANWFLYTGPGTIALNVNANGLSSASGGGNLTTIFNTQASAEYSVTYTYAPAPGSIALMGIGGLVAIRRRREA